MKRIYLDYAAGAPLLPVVQKKIQGYLAQPLVGNPSSLHTEGRKKQAILDEAHTRIASIIGVQPTEVILTSGATESNNLAIQGILAVFRREFPDKIPHIVISAIEHPSWYTTAEQSGAEITRVGVSKDGLVNQDDVLAAIKDTTALVGCAYVNNEIGTEQPVPVIGKAIQELRRQKGTKWPIFHTDAVQAFPYFNCHSGHLHADMITFSGHKYGALEGIGCLVVQSGTPHTAALRGGNQEWGMRAGTENIVGALSLTQAMVWQDETRTETLRHVTELQQHLESQLARSFPSTRILGQKAPRAPHITYIWLPDITDEHIMHALDLHGVAVASGSACSSGGSLPSATLLALGFSTQEAFGGIRISYGWETTQEEIDTFLQILHEILT